MQPTGETAAAQAELDMYPVGGYPPLPLSEEDLRRMAELGLPEPVDPHDPSPFSHNSTDTRREEDFHTDGLGLPTIEQRSLRSAMSHIERQAAYDASIARALEGPMDAKRLVMEYGPLSKLEKQMRGMVRDLTEFPEAGEVLLHLARRCMHDVVVSNPALQEKEQNETGLMARLEAADDMLVAMDDRLPAFCAELREACGVDIEPLRKSMRNCVEVEKRRLESLAQTLQPATFGNRVLSHIDDIKDAVVGAFQRDQLVGDVRRHRNDALARALEGLAAASGELRSNAGDPEWERGEGAMVAEHAGRFAEEIRSLTKGVEDQVDFGAVNFGLKKAQESIDDAASASADEEHRNRLKRAMEVMREALAAIAQALKKVFGRGDVSQIEPAKPTPF